ncbi:hypothetical protein BH23THE1_BH23THE1_18650 [soil metagenome]
MWDQFSNQESAFYSKDIFTNFKHPEKTHCYLTSLLFNFIDIHLFSMVTSCSDKVIGGNLEILFNPESIFFLQSHKHISVRKIPQK